MLEKSRGIVALALVIGMFMVIIAAIWRYETASETLELMNPLWTMFGTILGGVAGFYFNVKIVDQTNAQADQIATQAKKLIDDIDGIDGDFRNADEFKPKIEATMNSLKAVIKLRNI